MGRESSPKVLHLGARNCLVSLLPAPPFPLPYKWDSNLRLVSCLVDLEGTRQPIWRVRSQSVTSCFCANAVSSHGSQSSTYQSGSHRIAARLERGPRVAGFPGPPRSPGPALFRARLSGSPKTFGLGSPPPPAAPARAPGEVRLGRLHHHVRQRPGPRDANSASRSVSDEASDLLTAFFRIFQMFGLQDVIQFVVQTGSIASERTNTQSLEFGRIRQIPSDKKASYSRCCLKGNAGSQRNMSECRMGI